MRAGSKGLPREQWPELLRTRFGVVGVSVGRCVGTGRRVHARAHAHVHSRDHRGWICFQRRDGLDDVELVRHELAHLIAGAGHTRRFREILRDLGGALDHWSERERVAARGDARHAWVYTLHGAQGQWLAARLCAKCGLRKVDSFPDTVYRDVAGAVFRRAPACDRKLD